MASKHDDEMAGDDEEAARKRRKKEKKRAAEEAAQTAEVEAATLAAKAAQKKKRKIEREMTPKAADVPEADMQDAARKKRKQEKKKVAEDAARAAELEAAALEAKAARKKKRKAEAAQAAELEAAQLEARAVHKKKRVEEGQKAQSAPPEDDEDEAERARKKRCEARKKEAQQSVSAPAAIAKEEASTPWAAPVETAEWDWGAAPSRTRRGGKAARETAAAANVEAVDQRDNPISGEHVQTQAVADEGAIQQSVLPKVYAVHDRDACRILVGSLQPEVTEDMLRSQFEYCGEIGNVYVVTDRATGNCKGVGFITFSDTDGVAEALKANGSYFLSRKMNVSMATPKNGAKEKGADKGKGTSKGKGADEGKGKSNGKSKGSSKTPPPRPANCNGIVVKQLAFAATEEDLRETFKACGAGPTRVKLLYNTDTGQSKGIAFIGFEQEGVDTGKAAEEAVSLSGSALKGRPFYVEYN